MNKKALIVLAILAFSLLLTPIALATPGAEKSNEKFEYFYLECSGTGAEMYERAWTSPKVPALFPNVFHGRGDGWVTGTTVALTVDTETFDTTTTPYSVTWTTTYDVELFLDNDGNARAYHVRLTDVLTVWDGATEIGTLVLKLKTTFRDLTAIPIMNGLVVGYGTGQLKGVHISAVDLGNIGGDVYAREGTITGWPDSITNP